ncbi:MAG: hypothetical protein AB7E47_14630 [Desulfovibrionaceae bacterium]
MVIAMTQRIKHHMNPLHLYCRLREMGFSGPGARRLCRLYERFIYRAAIL